MMKLCSILFAFVSLMTTAALIACGGPGESSSDMTASPPASARTDRGPNTAPVSETRVDDRLGPALDRPERYYGVYASPERPDRQWFVAEAKRPKFAEQAPEVPPGHLALGAMFGDVAPWHLRTVSDTEFEQAWVPEYQPEPAVIVFELDADGHALAFRFADEQNAEAGRLERVGDVPMGWE